EGEYSKDLKDFTPDDFYLVNYQSHPAIKAPLSN
ncbi:MAG: Thymidylate synthase, partial [Bacteroidota bacterium]